MKIQIGILFLLFLIVISCADKQPESIKISDTHCLNLMPGEKELSPFSSRASDAFMACCKHSPNQNLNRVISAKPHNIFISFGDKKITSPDSTAIVNKQIEWLESRIPEGSETSEFLFKAGADWVYRIQIVQSIEPNVVLIDFVGRDSILMKKIFNTPRFASMRLQCAQ